MMTSTNVAVVYHSVTGTTAGLAEAVREGAAGIDRVNGLSVRIDERDIHGGRYRNTEVLAAISTADALIFGSPTFMGCVSAQFKAFADATSEIWAARSWAGKLAAGFTIGTNLSGDQLNTIQYLNIFASQQGMLWVGIDIPGGYDPEHRNRLGAQSGLIAHSADGHLHAADIKTAKYLGARVGMLARRIVLGADA